MTGGVVAVLGETGRNFAAGMSGGIAYVYDPDGDFEDRANTGMVTIHHDLEESDEAMLRRLVENHAAYTDSDRAATLLDDWGTEVLNFTKVMPDAYAEVIAEESREDVRTDLPEPASKAGGTEIGAGTVQTGDD
jgi:glutamate synthase (NADPH/NADH) large chain